jgi:hypothetical protein
MAAASEVSYEEQLRMLKEEREELMNQKAVRDAKAENDRLKSELAGATTGATSGATKVKPIEVAEVKMVIAADLSNLVIQGRKVIAAEMKGESICITFDGGEVVEMAFNDAVAAVVVGFFSLNDVKQVSKALKPALQEISFDTGITNAQFAALADVKNSQRVSCACECPVCSICFSV